MIPRTFPSIIEALQTKMVVYVLPSITGLIAWIDYIPVKGVTTESNALANTYATDGYQVVKTIESLTGKQAWLDYIPVFESASYNKPWSTDAGGYIPAGGLFSIASLFANGEQGTWYDPSDFTTLFQDSAGTTPVTAVQQPVGLMLDKSGRGNHAFQTTSASRPVLSARYNLLTKTEQFDDAVWTKTNTTVAADATTAPNGTLTADAVVESAGSIIPQIFQSNTSAGVRYTYVAYVKPNGRTHIGMRGSYVASNNWISVLFNLTSETAVMYAGSANTGTNHSAEIIGLANGWYRVTYAFTPAAGHASSTTRILLSNGSIPSGDAGTISYTGDGTSGIFAWGADLRVSNDALGQPAYQRVNTSTDYDTVGFKPYLAFDGVDDSLVTNSIDFTGTDKMTVFAGVRKLSDTWGMIAELSTNATSNNGAFLLTSYTDQKLYFGSRGSTTYVEAGGSAVAAPRTLVATGISAIGTPPVLIRENSAQTGSNTSSQGTGNYGNYPLFIGRRNQASLPLNGRLYSLIVRGAASTTTQITSTETYVNQKTGAY